jgi:hypothetical protein
MPFLPRRLGIAELESLLDDSLEVRHIAEPLESCNAADDARVVKGMMAKKNFDCLGVTTDGQITGYIRRDDLKDGQCGQYSVTFQANEIIASRTSLIELLQLFEKRPTYFVLDRAEINSIVHLADLHVFVHSADTSHGAGFAA